MQADRTNEPIAAKPLILALIAEGFVLGLIIAFPSGVVVFVRRSPILDVVVPLILGFGIALAAWAVFGQGTAGQPPAEFPRTTIGGIIGVRMRRGGIILCAIAAIVNLVFFYFFVGYWTGQ